MKYKIKCLNPTCNSETYLKYYQCDPHPGNTPFEYVPRYMAKCKDCEFLISREKGALTFGDKYSSPIFFIHNQDYVLEICYGNVVVRSKEPEKIPGQFWEQFKTFEELKLNKNNFNLLYNKYFRFNNFC